MANEKQNSGFVTVKIYDQAYHLSGQSKDLIRDLAEQVNAKMCAVAANGRTADSLRVAVLAALNLADELAQTKAELERYQKRSFQNNVRPGGARAASLRGLLDEVLEDERKTG